MLKGPKTPNLGIWLLPQMSARMQGNDIKLHSSVPHCAPGRHNDCAILEPPPPLSISLPSSNNSALNSNTFRKVAVGRHLSLNNNALLNRRQL